MIDSRIILAQDRPAAVNLPEIQQQALITGEMQARAQDRVTKARQESEARQQQAELMKYLGESIVEVDGVKVYDRNRVLPLLAQMPELGKLLDESDGAVKAAKTAQTDYLKRIASIIDMTGNDPLLFDLELTRAIDNGMVNEREAKAIRQAVQQDPTKVASITAALTGRKPDVTKYSPIGAESGVLNESTGQVTPTGLPPKPPADQGGFNLGPGARRFEPDPNNPGKFIQVAAVPPNPTAAQTSGGGVSTGKLPPQAQNILGKLTVRATQAQAPRIQAEAARLAGDEDALKEYLRGAAVEMQSATRRDVLLGRMETIQALKDAESLLKTIPTGLIAGTWEDTMRKLGTSSDPRMVELATMMGSVLANYVRSISGAAVTDLEAARLGKLLPNYGNTLPVNQGVMRGLSSSIRSFNEAFYQQAFGQNTDWVLGRSGAPRSGGGGDAQPDYTFDPATGKMVKRGG